MSVAPWIRVVEPTARVVEPVIGALLELLAALDSPGLTVHRYAPPNVIPPAAVVDLPSVRRRELLEAEGQFGSNEWLIDVPVTLYFDLRVAENSQALAVDVLEQWIQLVDANAGLGLGDVIETKVTEAEPAFVLDQNRTLASYETTVECLREYVYP